MANRGRSGVLRIILAMVALLLVAGCADFFPSANLTAITVTASNGSTTPSVNVGAMVQMVANGTFDNGNRSTITASWSSQAANIATVNQSTGVVTGVAPGTATITAAASGLTGTASVTVCGAITAITISPLNQSFPLGTGSVQFTATQGAGGSDITSSVTWSSSTPTVATISNISGTNGKATLVGTGSTTITAASCTLNASTGLTVQ